MPRRPEPTVAELSARLYSAYQVDGGTVRLAGCTLEVRPILHVTARADEGDVEVYVAFDGTLLDAPTVRQLGLNSVARCNCPVQDAGDEVERLCEVTAEALAGQALPGGVKPAEEVAQHEVIWCRWAAGKLRFSIGARSVEAPFADWAIRLAPPPVICPYTHSVTFHLAATSDGRIAAAEKIAECEISGSRMLSDELITCSVTGKRVDRELTETCPVTGEPVIREQMTRCPTCLGRVSPSAARHERCLACSDPQPVTRADPRLCLIIAEHRGLDRWRTWRLAETPSSYVVEARGLWRQSLLVIDRQSLQPLRLAQRDRLHRKWIDVTRDRWSDWLR